MRFLLASIIAVSVGLSIAYWKDGTFSISSAVLTYAGVTMLHGSVDLLNDYWDHKRGIDGTTVRTPFSGGTGVLPENLLTPRSVYLAGVMFLVFGGCIGAYFVYLRGPAIAVILAFAIIAIYFYSTSIVNSGLGEFFVAIKGAMIVLGSYYVQTGSFASPPLYSGVIVGLLSATVLLSNSFPDYQADKSKGRRTLVIMLGRKKAAFLFPLLIATTYGLIGLGVLLAMTKVYSLVCIVSIPLAFKAARHFLADQECIEKSLVPAMESAVAYSRLTGIVLAFSFLL